MFGTIWLIPLALVFEIIRTQEKKRSSKKIVEGYKNAPKNKTIIKIKNFKITLPF